ncbi:MAG: type II toxin-antitoxin system HicA family toxin [Ignavibacteriaceae bacterium]
MPTLDSQNYRPAYRRQELILSLGFKERINGDHHIYSKTGIAEIINIQPLNDGKAKPYQVKQIRNLIHKYKLNKD